MKRRFSTVNVFSKGPLEGNPVAVVLDSDGLDTKTMQAFTQWTSLSEATFVSAPSTDEADYRVRIFTLEREMPFAGHPTLGTARAWLDAGGVSRRPDTVVQECGAGLVEIRIDDDLMSFRAPPLIRDEPIDADDQARMVGALGVNPADVVDSHWLDNGPGWAVLLLSSADAVLAAEPAAVDGSLDVGLVALRDDGAGPLIEVRALFSDHVGHIREDPVTGSLNAAVAQWLFRTGRADGSYVAEQGRRVGRRGRVHLSETGGAVWVGGMVTTVCDGHVEL